MFALLKYRKQLLGKLLPIILAFVLGFTTAFLYLSLNDLRNSISTENENSPGARALSFRSDSGSPSSLDKSSFLIVIIFTSVKNSNRRQTIRDTWLKFSTDRRVKHYFVIGTLNLDVDDHEALNSEHLKYNDLLLLPYLKDQYERLTGKLVESLKWVSKLGDFDYVLKVDDDSFVRLDALYNEVVEKDRNWPKAQKLLYWGYFDGRAHVKRVGQWAEREWFLCDRYLPYALGGGYVLSRKLVDYIVTNSPLLQSYKSEDVSLGVWLAPLKINRVHDVRFDTEYQSRGCIDSYLIQHKQSTLDMKSKYISLSTQERLCTSGEIERKLAYEYNWRVPPSKCCVRNVTMTSR